MPVFCVDCNKPFSTQYNLNKHLRTVHKKKSKHVEYFSEKKYMCVECNVYFYYNNALRSHLEEKHNFKNIVEKINFKTFTDFSQWLSQEETINKVQYAKNTGKKKSGRDTEKIYFECIRSYKKSKALNENRKRKLKKQGSCKMAKSCVSQIIVSRHKGSDECSVLYFKSHYLHDTVIKHMRISKPEKEMIASKLILGIPSKTILNKTRENISEDLKRIDLITGSDIRNIRRAYSLKLKNGCYHHNNSTSVDVRVKKCAEGDRDNNPVLFYKPQGHSLDNFERNEEEAQHLAAELSNGRSDKVKEKIKSNIFQILRTLEMGNLSCEQLQLMLQHTNTCVAVSTPTTQEIKFEIIDVNINEPVNKSITKQESFSSTDYQNRAKGTCSKESEEKPKIIKEFVNNDKLK